MNEYEAGVLVWPEWTIEGTLGEGAFGGVYLGKNAETGAYAAVKVITVPPSEKALSAAQEKGIGDETLRAYFRKFRNDLRWEMTLYKSVQSEHLVPYDFMRIENNEKTPGFSCALRMELYTPINTYFAKGSDAYDAAHLGQDIAKALEACERLGMVHGEVKPENILVSDGGSFLLSDFGIRRCLEKAGSGLFGEFKGDFEAPELEKEAKYTVLTDIYALGMVMMKTANSGVMPVGKSADLITNISPELAAVIKKATAFDPAERFQTVSELLAAIQRAPETASGRRPYADAVGTALKAVKAPEVDTAEVPAEKISEPAIEPEAQEKTGFFKRLFKKKKKD